MDVSGRASGGEQEKQQYPNSSGREGPITYCIELVYYFSVKFTVWTFQCCAAVGLNIWVSDATDIWITYDGPGGCGGEANGGYRKHKIGLKSLQLVCRLSLLYPNVEDGN